MLKGNTLKFREHVKKHILFLMGNGSAFEDCLTYGAQLETFYNILCDERGAYNYNFPSWLPIISAPVIVSHITHGAQKINFCDNLQDIVNVCANWFCENETEYNEYIDKYIYKYNHARDKQKMLDSFIMFYAGRIAWVFEKMYKEGKPNG